MFQKIKPLLKICTEKLNKVHTMSQVGNFHTKSVFLLFVSSHCRQDSALRSQQEGLLLSMLSKTNMLFIFSLLIAGDHTATSEMILTRYALLQIDKYDC